MDWDSRDEDGIVDFTELEFSRLGWEERFGAIPAPRAGLGNALVPPFLFDGFLRQNTLTMIAADPFVGKTMLLLAMMLSLDSKRPLFDRFAPAQEQHVLFLGRDSPTWDYRGVFQKLVRGLALPEPEVEAFRSHFVLNREWTVLDKEFWDFLTESKNLFNTRVLMLDTLADFHPFDENSNKEMAKLMGLFKKIRDTLDISVMFTHHNAKLAEVMGYSSIAAPRGAGKISGSSDHILMLRRMKSGSVAVSMPKGRGLNDLEALSAFSIEPGENSHGEPILTLAPSKTLWDAVVETLAEQMTRDELAKRLVVKYPDRTEKQIYSQLNNALRALSRMGKVVSPKYGSWIAARQKGKAHVEPGSVPPI